MADTEAGRVAVYIDFDNIVISRYDEVHGRGSFQRDRQKAQAGSLAEPEFQTRLEAATVDVGAGIDFASSFGTLVLTRAYADWSAPVNARYRGQLVGRAVDLVQLFPAAAYGKNGADIRLAVDAVEDMFRLPDLTHVVIVSGDSDYIALAQRCKRLGRYVVGIGVAGSTSRALAAACDELVTYDSLPGTTPPAERPAARRPTREAAGEQAPEQAPEAGQEPEGRRRRRRADDARSPEVAAAADAPAGQEGRKAEAPHVPAFLEPIIDGDRDVDDEDDEEQEDPQAAATALLLRALRLGHQSGDDEWLHNSAVKTQMKRLDPSFSERRLGFRSFSDFLRSRAELVDLDESSTARLVRLGAA